MLIGTRVCCIALQPGVSGIISVYSVQSQLTQGGGRPLVGARVLSAGTRRTEAA